MYHKIKVLFIGVVSSLLISLPGCKDVKDQDIYQTPSSLEGKLYSQIVAEGGMDYFVKALKKTGYQDLLDRSGFVTVFAPTDEAFEKYLSEHGEYSSFESIPISVLNRIVRYHIVQNGWNKWQLTHQDANGWSEEDDQSGFKRETIYKDSVQVQTGVGGKARNVLPEYRKFVPIFYQDYFNMFDYVSSDYEFFFPDQKWDANALFFAGAKVLKEEIPAENGFLYVVNKIVEPLPNLDGALKSKSDYSAVAKLFEQFADYKRNDEEMAKQAGAGSGSAIDTLYDKTYPDLLFNLNEERITLGLGQNEGTVNNYTLFVPTNDALQALLDKTIHTYYSSIFTAPEEVVKNLLNSFMRAKVTYPSELSVGVINGVKDVVSVTNGDIKDKIYCSNGTFYGLNNMFVPQMFSSITGPIYLNPNYSVYMRALENTGLTNTLKKEDYNFTLLSPSNEVLEVDSSLLYFEDIERLVRYESGSDIALPVNKQYLLEILLNHVLIGKIEGGVEKEYMQTLGGNFICVDHLNSAFIGGGNKDSLITFNKVDYETNNGETYDIKGLLTMPSADVFRELVSNSKETQKYNKFYKLLETAGLIYRNERISFIPEGEQVTAFIPSNELLDGYTYENIAELTHFIKGHFIQGEVLFTDGKKTGSFKTYQTYETDNGTSYKPIKINAAPDLLEIVGSDGEIIATVVNNESNVITTNGAIHKIDKYIVLD